MALHFKSAQRCAPRWPAAVPPLTRLPLALLAATFMLRGLPCAEADGDEFLRSTRGEDPTGLRDALQRSAGRASGAQPEHGGAQAGQSGGPHYWPHARGHEGQYMLTEHTIPANLSAAHAWTWVYPAGRYHTTVRGNPLIDHEGNIIVSTEQAVFKLSPDGHELWAYYPQCLHINQNASAVVMNSVPSIMDGFVYGQCSDSSTWKVDLETGKEVFRVRQAVNCGMDAHFVEAYEGVVVQGVDNAGTGGNRRILGVSAENATKLWEFHPNTPVWNVDPLLVEGATGVDSSIIFMDWSGGVYRISLHNGTLIWHSPPPVEYSLSFSDGGVMVGPDGTAYACSNLERGMPGSFGSLRAYRFEDGQKLWDTTLPMPCTSWPAIARGGGWGVVPIGNFVALPLLVYLPGWMPQSLKLAIHALSLALGPNMRWLVPQIPVTHTEVVAFDTKTGQLAWRFRTPDWQRLAAMGDEEGILERVASNATVACLPTSWGTPTIAGDGTVYVGHVSGMLYALKDVNGDGVLDEKTEVDAFNMGGAPLPCNAAWAPNFMAIASCDSVFAFKR